MKRRKKKKKIIYLVHVLLLGINSTKYITLLLIYSMSNLFTTLINSSYTRKEAVFQDTVHLSRCVACCQRTALSKYAVIPNVRMSKTLCSNYTTDLKQSDQASRSAQAAELAEILTKGVS